MYALVASNHHADLLLLGIADKVFHHERVFKLLGLWCDSKWLDEFIILIIIAHLGHVSGCLHELGKLLVADLVHVHAEGVECDSTCRTLAVLGHGGVVLTHGECAARQCNHTNPAHTSLIALGVCGGVCGWVWRCERAVTAGFVCCDCVCGFIFVLGSAGSAGVCTAA